MWNTWDDNLSDAQSDYLAKLRAKNMPVKPFGIGVTYVGPDTYFPSDAERQRATQISIKKEVVSPTTSWKTCASIDSVTGECASFTVGQDAQPLPPWVLGPSIPPPGIIPPGVPVRGIDQMPSTRATTLPVPAPSTTASDVPSGSGQTCPPGRQVIGFTQSIPPRVICGPAVVNPGPTQPTDIVATPPPGVTTPTQTTPGGIQRRTRYQPAATVELCPLAGWVTRPIPGAAEYQVYRCQPGQRVVIDRGLQEAGIREALARADVTAASEAGSYGVAGAAPSPMSSESKPNWLLLGGIAAGALLLLSGRRGR